MQEYAIEIFYLDDDEGDITVMPGPPGCSASEEAEEPALREVRIAEDLWREMVKNEELHISGAQGKELLQGIPGKKDQERAFS